MFANEGKRSMRRGFPLHAYVGANGSGKSAAMVWDTMPSLLEGRQVLSTVRLLDFERPHECEGCDDPGHTRPVYRRLPKPEGLTMADWVRGTEPEDRKELIGYTTHRAANPLWIPFTDWGQVFEYERIDLLMDEVTGVASSRDSMTMPTAIANELQQMRRDDVVVRWTGPSWKRADTIIRECTQAVTHCRGMLPKRAEDGAGRAYRQRRAYRLTTYDARLFEEFSEGQRQKLDRVQSDLLAGRRSGVFDAYDTYDAVLSIGTVTEHGTCYRCGGNRRRPACSCKSTETCSTDAVAA